jgi:hypothetical protein
MEQLTDKQLLNSLALAAEKGRYQDFLKLVKPEKVNDPIYEGGSVLVLFASCAPIDGPLGQGMVVDQLLEWGADINASDGGEMTALHRAVSRSNPGLIRHLLRRGADMRRKSKWAGLTPIQLTTGSYSYEIFMLHGAKPGEFEASCFKTKESRETNIKDFYGRIVAARRIATIFIGMSKRSPLLRLVVKDMVLQIARAIYSTRGNILWNPPVPLEYP